VNQRWAAVAARAIDALGVQPGDVVEVREHAGHYEALLAMVLEIERRGATPRIELLPPDLVSDLLTSTDPEILSRWDEHRSEWMHETDRVLVLEGADSDVDTEQPAVEAWRVATDRLVQIEEDRRLPYLLIAIPTEARAEQCGTRLDLLENALIPALTAPPDELKRETDRLERILEGAGTLTVETGTHKLLLDISGRHWMHDAGEMPSSNGPDGVQPALNLPAGSVYITVNETATSGTLYLPEAASAVDVVLEFSDGRITRIRASNGADALTAMFDRHSGEPRRVSHIGIGLNPRLHTPVGWPLVDEHRHGAVFIAFGENRYLGGQNESSLNVDFVVPAGTLIADDRTIVERGTVLV
jgi:leucyl aminopeptidase (aminopeptidase T)